MIVFFFSFAFFIYLSFRLVDLFCSILLENRSFSTTQLIKAICTRHLVSYITISYYWFARFNEMTGLWPHVSRFSISVLTKTFCTCMPSVTDLLLLLFMSRIQLRHWPRDCAREEVLVFDQTHITPYRNTYGVSQDHHLYALIKKKAAPIILPQLVYIR